ncbi:predicted protein [Phaeodactylum tricornutum CCAP 1055/1]|jgi:hypothetical protein|uniref:Uncharacterized protein n=1 Tax=Phaeodactylum tricornutum (strain CCAP 1055/1) TaxID=556484 RepID=B7FU80_PHATC|nr:predicted protein [Phaeodactylum tricornutum CCAP 1055/1]EEC49937.1 predicted protein [Phaeodactylum tricornutum CCAP 1055/1]|eukprot:XP_002178272.1 predicted protein [Phaeodactylum tricornutum CCAP 1055/1]
MPKICDGCVQQVLVGNVFQQSLLQPVQAFGPALVPHYPRRYAMIQQRVSSDLEDVDVENEAILGYNNIPPTTAHCIPTRKDPIQSLDSMTYESDLIKTWEQDPSQQKGFYRDVERLRRYFAGLPVIKAVYRVLKEAKQIKLLLVV